MDSVLIWNIKIIYPSYFSKFSNRNEMWYSWIPLEPGFGDIGEWISWYVRDIG